MHHSVQRIILAASTRRRLALLGFGLALEVAFVLVFVASSFLDWYPSRLGAPSIFLLDHFISIFRPIFVSNEGKRSLLAGVCYLLFLATAFSIYALAIFWASRVGKKSSLQTSDGDSRKTLALIMLLSALFCLSLLFQPFVASQDIFSYASYARIFALYGGNPYIDAPRDFPFDPLFQVLFWKDQPSNYGPLWTYLSGALALITGGSVSGLLIALKATAALFLLGGIPLVWGTLGRFSPGERLAGTLFYAWNPLLIMESAGSGHNDVMMAFFLILAAFFYVRKRVLLAVVGLMLAALTKYVALMIVPIFLLVILIGMKGNRERLALVLKVGLISVGMTLAAFLPVYAGPGTFQIFSFGSNPLAYANSPLELAFRELRVAFGESRETANLPLRYRGSWVESKMPTVFWSLPDNPKALGVSLPTGSNFLMVEPTHGKWVHVYSPQLDSFGYVFSSDVVRIQPPADAGIAGTAAIVLEDQSRMPTARMANAVVRGVATSLFALCFLWILYRNKKEENTFDSSLRVIFLSYLLIQTWFWPWYIIWALPFAALRPRSRVSALLVAFSFTTLVLNAQAEIELTPILSTAYEYRSAVIFGLPLLGIVLWFWKLRKRDSKTRLRPVTERQLILPAFSVARLSLRSVLTPLFISAQIVFLFGIGVTLATGQHLPTSPTVDTSSVDQAWQVAYATGKSNLYAGQYSQAVVALNRAAKLRPEAAETYQARYIAFLLLGKPDDAAQDLTRLIDSDGPVVGYLLARSQAYTGLQRYELALADLDQAQALDPQDSRAFRQRALIYYEQGKSDEAVGEMWKAVTLIPSYAPLYAELGDMYASSRDFEAARSMYDKALELDPKLVDVYASRAAVYRKLGRQVVAIDDLESVRYRSSDIDERLWAERELDLIAVRLGDPLLTANNSSIPD